MRIAITAGLLAALLLAGCVTDANNAAEPAFFARADCQRMTLPEVERHFEVAKSICGPKAEAAQIAGTAAIPVGYGIGGAMASGIERGVTGAKIRDATILSCMAEQGYLFRTASAHEAACAVGEPRKSAAKR